MSPKTLKFQAVTRVFQHGSLEIPDPNPRMAPEEIKRMLATQYPELNNAAIEGPEIRSGKQVFTFQKALGTKG